MKTVRQDLVEKANRLYKITQARKSLDAEEQKIKAEFKKFMGKELFLQADNILITQRFDKRTTLDKEALKLALGEDYLADFEKTTEYAVMQIQEIAPALETASVAASQ